LKEIELVVLGDCKGKQKVVEKGVWLAEPNPGGARTPIMRGNDLRNLSPVDQH
jgi:hypothetical protein